MNITMCLRRKWSSISSSSCKAHVRHLAAQAFANTLLDTPLLRACSANITQHCMEPNAALVCLKGLLANGLTLAPECTAVLQERLLEAAGALQRQLTWLASVSVGRQKVLGIMAMLL
jgi:hypothetical protein